MTREQWINIIWIVLRGVAELGLLWFGWYFGRRAERALWRLRLLKGEFYCVKRGHAFKGGICAECGLLQISPLYLHETHTLQS